MTDTDSLCFEIRTKDIVADLMRDEFWLKEMDTSNYPTSHPLYSEVNKKTPGFFKDVHPEGILEFIGLGAKCYHLELNHGGMATAKGVKKAIKKQKLTRDAYFATPTAHENFDVDIYNINAKDFMSITIHMLKKALTAFDDKFWIEDDGITTRPFE